MGFADRYVHSLGSSNLKDDDLHQQAEPLVAAALADLSGGSGSIFGSMLVRAKVSGVPRQAFESGTHGLGVLLRVWTEEVAKKGFDRGWMKIKAEWDIAAAYAMFKKIAQTSLAHWLDGQCKVCNGTKVVLSRACMCCGGSGRAPIEGRQREIELVEEMVSELEGFYEAYCARAAAKLRRVA